MSYHRSNGFTLIELLITVAIIGILSTIALPVYTNYIVKGSRAAAQTELLNLASLQEKIYLNSNNYTNNLTTAYDGTTTGGLGKTTAKTSDGKYGLTLAVGALNQTYTITATPVTGTSQANDGPITIQENGSRLWNGVAW